MQLLYATTNPGKLTEAKELLTTVKLLSLNDFSELADMDVEETGSTFRENAYIKAKAYGDIARVLTVAEDAGLVIDALDGAPGVYSARFAPTTEERNQKVLSLMRDKKNRTARFVATLCLYNPETQDVRYFEGIVEGSIAQEVHGSAGFGYDPIFIPQGYNQTFGELTISVKNKISHRQQAIEKLKEFLA